VSYEDGQIVEVKDRPGSYWQITKLGVEDFYATGEKFYEADSTLTLYIPAPGRSWRSYDVTIYRYREEFFTAPPLVVLAQAAARKTSAVANLRRRWRARRRA